MRPDSSLPPEYFETRYRQNHDPWNFATSAYEQRKYAATLNAFTKNRYHQALEVGCSIGIFTRMLAERCETVTALDVSETALNECRQRCKDSANVVLKQGSIPMDWPQGQYDLIVFSEVLYYLSREDLSITAERTRRSLKPEADIVLVHWLGETDYPLTGNEAAELFIQQLAGVTTLKAQDWTQDYRLDLLQSTAADPGIASDNG